MDDGLKCPTDLPYFEGDFWPNVLEESIKELDQEEEERQKAAEKAAAAQQSTSEEVGGVSYRHSYYTLRIVQLLKWSNTLSAVTFEPLSLHKYIIVYIFEKEMSHTNPFLA